MPAFSHRLSDCREPLHLYIKRTSQCSKGKVWISQMSEQEKSSVQDFPNPQQENREEERFVYTKDIRLYQKNIRKEVNNR
jgi:hypothetical protein